MKLTPGATLAALILAPIAFFANWDPTLVEILALIKFLNILLMKFPTLLNYVLLFRHFKWFWEVKGSQKPESNTCGTQLHYFYSITPPSEA
jgi:hypothetical protein